MLLPGGEIVAHTLIDRDGYIRFDNMKGYVSDSQTLSGDVRALQTSEKLELQRFSTLSYFSDGDEVVDLYRQHRTFDTLSPEELVSAALAASEYLTRSVGPDGKFVYIYYPKSDSVPDDYNILRHAGAIYAMLEVYDVTGDRDLLEAAERAIGYLVTMAQPCEAEELETEVLCIVEDGEVKLGGNALAIIALAKYTELTGNQEHYPLMVALGNWMRSVQGFDGEFKVHLLDLASGKSSSFRSDYYPGEALLALMRLYTLDSDPAWLDSAEAGAEWLITVRDSGLDTSELAHDHWLLYALNELYRQRPQELFSEHAFKISDAIIAAQNRNPQYPDWLGSYNQPPRSTPTATRSEGLFSTYLLARDHGYEDRAAAILEALKLNVAFQLSTQFRPESVMYLKDPQRSMGGFHRSLDNYELRIDYTQHNISALLGLYKILNASPVE